MEIILVLAALWTTPVTYSVKPGAVIPSTMRSCGASSRMLRERHRITVSGDNFYVNGMRWANLTDSRLPGEAYLASRLAQQTWATLWLIANDNRLIGLYAVTGSNCQDLVRVEGQRL